MDESEDVVLRGTDGKDLGEGLMIDGGLDRGNGRTILEPDDRGAPGLADARNPMDRQGQQAGLGKAELPGYIAQDRDADRAGDNDMGREAAAPQDDGGDGFVTAQTGRQGYKRRREERA